MGDVDHRDTPGLQLTDNIEEAFLFFYRDGRRRLIQDQNTGVTENGFADLHDLAVRHGEISDPGSWGNMTLEFLQKLLGLLITLRFVHEEAVIAPIAHEKVVCNGHGLKLNHLLIHHRDTQFERLLRCQVVIGDAVKNDLALVGLYGAGDGLDEGGLAGAVLSDQRVHLAFPEADGYIVEGNDARIAFCDIVQFKQFQIRHLVGYLFGIAFLWVSVYRNHCFCVVTRVTIAGRKMCAAFVQKGKLTEI